MSYDTIFSIFLVALVVLSLLVSKFYPKKDLGSIKKQMNESLTRFKKENPELWIPLPPKHKKSNNDRTKSNN